MSRPNNVRKMEQTKLSTYCKDGCWQRTDPNDDGLMLPTKKYLFVWLSVHTVRESFQTYMKTYYKEMEKTPYDDDGEKNCVNFSLTVSEICEGKMLKWCTH